MGGNLQCVWEDALSGSRAVLLQQLLAWAGGFPPVQNVWCGKCYRESASDPFPRLDDNEKANGSDLDLDTTSQTSSIGAGGTGIISWGPFECDLCSFRNVTGRDPVLGDHNDHGNRTP